MIAPVVASESARAQTILVIEGISFASTYRTSFEQEVRQAGLDGLNDRMGELNSRRDGAPSPPG